MTVVLVVPGSAEADSMDGARRFAAGAGWHGDSTAIY
jgi:hypothetical protein